MKTKIEKGQRVEVTGDPIYNGERGTVAEVHISRGCPTVLNIRFVDRKHLLSFLDTEVKSLEPKRPRTRRKAVKHVQL